MPSPRVLKNATFIIGLKGFTSNNIELEFRQRVLPNIKLLAPKVKYLKSEVIVKDEGNNSKKHISLAITLEGFKSNNIEFDMEQHVLPNLQLLAEKATLIMGRVRYVDEAAATEQKADVEGDKKTKCSHIKGKCLADDNRIQQRVPRKRDESKRPNLESKLSEFMKPLPDDEQLFRKPQVPQGNSKLSTKSVVNDASLFIHEVGSDIGSGLYAPSETKSLGDMKHKLELLTNKARCWNKV
mmetsp:Transcript_3597/g.4800  ORF Transcript_3597/g.4800 Transcript_3597/m.4800 type:complete len:240 (+) Transcript_3597:60-779(+)